jgi:hypothetical protein
MKLQSLENSSMEITYIQIKVAKLKYTCMLTGKVQSIQKKKKKPAHKSTQS